MGAAFLLVLAAPWLQDFFALKLVGVAKPWVAVGIAVVAAATWSLWGGGSTAAFPRESVNP